MYLNQATASLRRIPFELVDSSTGAAVTGATFSAAEVQVSKAGAAYVNATGSVVEIGAGSYYYQGASGDVDTLGLLIVKVNKAGSLVYKYGDEVIAAPSVLVASDVATAVFGFAHQSGRTFKGVIKRLDQLMAGKHTGLLGTLWKMFDVDGTTELVRAAQDPVAGTRDAATTVAGD